MWFLRNNVRLHEKTNNSGFRPGLTQIGLCSYRKGLEACNFGFNKKRNCTICVVKTKVLISCAVTAQLICAYVFAYIRLLVFWCGGSNREYSVWLNVYLFFGRDVQNS